MAYQKTVWKDRIVEHPRRFTMTTNPDGTITLTPSPGNIVDAGTKVTAEELNRLEAAVEAVFNDQVTEEERNNWNQAEQNAKDYADQKVEVVNQKVLTHEAEMMPHKYIDDGKTYRWGFRTVNGKPQFIYEEVQD